MPTLPFRFGDWTPPPALAAIPGTSIAWVADHGTDAAGLLLSQFQGRPRIEAFLRALLAGVQDLDDGIYQVLIGIWIDGAEGVQLDELGEILALPRAGWPDTTYRTFLRAQVLVYRSEGTWPDIVGLLAALGVTKGLTFILDSGVAEMRITIGELLTGGVFVQDVYRMVVAAKPAGVRLMFTYPTIALDHAFTLSTTTSAVASSTLGLGDSVAGGIGGLLDGLLATTEAA